MVQNISSARISNCREKHPRAHHFRPFYECGNSRRAYQGRPSRQCYVDTLYRNTILCHFLATIFYRRTYIFVSDNCHLHDAVSSHQNAILYVWYSLVIPRMVRVNDCKIVVLIVVCGWISAYIYAANPTLRALLMVLVTSMATIYNFSHLDNVISSPPFHAIVAYICNIMLFLAPIVLPRLRPIFASPSLRYLGYISYPLYLSHEDSVAAIAQYLYVTSGGSVALSAILIAVVLVIFSATLVAKFDEPFVRRLLAPFYVAITQALIGARAPTPSFATEQRIETTQATALL